MSAPFDEFGNITAPSPAPTAAEMPMDQRRQALHNAIAQEVARKSRVESQTDQNAILVRGSKPNHVLHLILTLATCTMWAPVWIGLAIFQKEHRTQVSVDPYGNILRNPLS